jgi:hypothetical protein
LKPVWIPLTSQIFVPVNIEPADYGIGCKATIRFVALADANTRVGIDSNDDGVVDTKEDTTREHIEN